MSLFHLVSLLMAFVASFGYINARYIKLPTTIGLLLVSVVFSLLLLALGQFYPEIVTFENELMSQIDFGHIVLDGILCFLLFAGTLQIDTKQLTKERLPVALFATLGVLVSTGLIGGFFFWGLQWIGSPIPFFHCLVFGALISPTDPVAVVGILKEIGVAKSLETKIMGESLFNDGVGYVLFLTFLQLALSGDTVADVHLDEMGLLFLREMGGGLLLGGILGLITYTGIRRVDSYEIEMMLTLSLVMVTYSLAEVFGVSGPISVVVAGLISIKKIRTYGGVSEKSADYLKKFWELIDVLLNAFLFLLIGLEIWVVVFDGVSMWAGLLMIPALILSRYISIKFLILSFKKWYPFEKHLALIMTWGGLRGGISIAMALSLPSDFESRAIILTTTYVIVLFSILVQGLSLGKVIKRLGQQGFRGS